MSKKIILAALFVFALGIVLVISTKRPTGDNIINQNQAVQDTDPGARKDSTDLTEGQANNNVRSDNGEGGVQVEAVLVTPEYFKAAGQEDLLKKYDLSKNIVFEIAMTTHMGDLTQYPISEQAELTVNGETFKPSGWDTSANDSHHPRGYLVFPVKTDIQKSKLQLSLKNLNGIPNRLFSW